VYAHARVPTLEAGHRRSDDAIELIHVHGAIECSFGLLKLIIQFCLGCVAIDAWMPFFKCAAKNAEIFAQFLRRHTLDSRSGCMSRDLLGFGARRLWGTGWRPCGGYGGESTENKDSENLLLLIEAHEYSLDIPRVVAYLARFHTSENG